MGMSDPEQRRLRPYGWQFIGLAGLGVNTAGSYAAAAAIIIVAPLLTAVLLGLAVGISAAVKHDPPGTINPVMAAVEQYVPIILAGAAVLYSVARIHRRPWQSLVAPNLRIDRRRLAIGFGVELAILAGQLAILRVAFGWTWAFSLRPVLPLIAAGLLLVPLQAASEEILFRAYLTQALGRIVRSRIAIALAVALVFGLLHLNAYGPLTVPYFFVVSLIFSLVSLRDDRLELAIGGHSAMNLVAFTLAASVPVEPGQIGIVETTVTFNGAAIAILILNGALFYGLTRLFVGLLCDRSPPDAPDRIASI